MKTQEYAIGEIVDGSIVTKAKDSYIKCPKCKYENDDCSGIRCLPLERSDDKSIYFELL